MNDYFKAVKITDNLYWVGAIDWNITDFHGYASKMGQKAITGHFHRDCAVTAVADGEVISLGDREIRCYETRMLHWPDSMISYLPDDGILFSQDAFGMHLASDHGPIYRTEKDIRTIRERYAVWAGQKPALKAVVVYDTMWNSTDMMARSIADGLAHGGVRVKVMPMRAAHRSDVATELLDAGALLAGSPTLNNTIFPTVADVMVYLKGLRPKNLIGAAFGSYGWGGEAVGQLEELLDEMKVERVAESIRVEYVPEESDLVQCFELGVSIAEKLKEMC